MNVRLQLCLALAVTLVGCEANRLPDENESIIPAETSTATAEPDTVEPDTAADVAPKSNAKPESTAEATVATEEPPAETSSTESDSTANQNATAETVASREKAAAGVGKKGQGYGGGPVSEPARLYFRIRERAVFDIQIPQALKMYKAINGKGPADHEEFMKKIIQENSISLPELPAGKKYAFDAEKDELMIERSEG